MAKKHTDNKIYFIAFFYHLIFTFLSFDYFSRHGGDASKFWYLISNSTGSKYLDNLFFGTNFIRFINYPFVQILNLKIEFGFLIYSIIGFLGILNFYELTKRVIGKELHLFNVNIVPLVLFIPNLNYWTSILGKEPIVFLLLTIVFIQYFEKNIVSFKMLLSVLLLLLIRPHIVFVVMLSFLPVTLFLSKNSVKQKTIYFITGLLLLISTFYMFLQQSNIRVLDWEKIKAFNQFALLSNQNSNSYIPMIEYNIVERIFAFYFRPLFYDSNSFYGFVLSFENFIWLILHFVTIILIIKNYKKLNFSIFILSIISYLLIGGLLFVQRYSDLGLIVRTKIMLQPFFIIVFLWIFKVNKACQNQN